MTSTQSNFLILEPSDELKFYQPFDPPCCTTLTVTNPTPYAVCFKFKTTASHRYSVKPKLGVISPLEKIAVQFKVKHQADLSSADDDKFKLIYFKCSSDDADDPEKAWERSGEESAFSIVLPVVFDEESSSTTLDPYSGGGGGGEENSATHATKKNSRKDVSHATTFEATSVMSWLKLLAFVIVGGLAAYIAQVVDLKATNHSMF